MSHSYHLIQSANLPQLLLLGSLGLSASSWLLGCQGEVAVGDARSEDATASSEDETTTTDTSEADTDETSSNGLGGDQAIEEASCVESDTLKLDNYEAWKALPNEWSSLAGKTFAGYVEGGSDIVLAIDDDQGAKMVFGKAVPPPEKDKGYLCDEESDWFNKCSMNGVEHPPEGATFDIHGASLQGSRLKIILPPGSAYDEWCALQTPVLSEGDESCLYQLLALAPLGYDLIGTDCHYDNQPVDCGWLDLAFQGRDTCTCSSTQCFASIPTPSDDPQYWIDARLNDDGTGYTGTLIHGEYSYVIYLDEITP